MSATPATCLAAQRFGFSLIELLFTLTLAAIALIIAVPVFSEFGQRQRMDAAVTDLHNHLMLARNEAIYRNVQIVACPGDAIDGCLDTTDWSDGWLVFSDLNEDRSLQAGESVHRSEPGLELLAISSSNGRTSLRFMPNGSAPGSNVSISFCDRRGPEKARKLVISNSGRIRRDVAPETESDDCPQP